MKLDLDHFKLINESYGHKIGDSLLESVMQRFKKLTSKSESLYALGGDQFIILFQAIDNINNVIHLVKKYFNALSHPFPINSHEINITATAGISVFPENGIDSSTLLKNAELAHLHAKKSGKNNYMLFTPAMAQHIKEEAEMCYDLKHALSNNEFLLYYQPVVNVANGSIINLEALLRWNRPNKGIILPGEFLSLAEETGLIFDICDWVMKTACEQNIVWKSQGISFLPVSINLSMRQFHGNSRLLESLRSVIDKSQVPPECLEFEMSENVTVLDIGSDLIEALNAMDIKLTIDDFGANYFSLNELKRYQIDNIKIDRVLVTALTQNDNATSIVTAIIAMCKELGINVFAEGVETKEQLQFLDKHGCYKMQGNYICPPLTAEQLLPILKGEDEFPFKKALGMTPA